MFFYLFFILPFLSLYFYYFLRTTRETIRILAFTRNRWCVGTYNHSVISHYAASRVEKTRGISCMCGYMFLYTWGRFLRGRKKKKYNREKKKKVIGLKVTQCTLNYSIVTIVNFVTMFIVGWLEFIGNFFFNFAFVWLNFKL